MNENELKKYLINDKKTERLVFAVSKEMKQAVEAIARGRCTSVSSLLIGLTTQEVLANKDLVEGASTEGGQQV